MNMKRVRWPGKAASLLLTTAMITAMAVILAPGASAKELPKTFAWSAYSVKSSGYAQSVAIGNALSAKGHKLRVIPGKNDISRMAPLPAGQVAMTRRRRRKTHLVAANYPNQIRKVNSG